MSSSVRSARATGCRACRCDPARRPRSASSPTSRPPASDGSRPDRSSADAPCRRWPTATACSRRPTRAPDRAGGARRRPAGAAVRSTRASTRSSSWSRRARLQPGQRAHVDRRSPREVRGDRPRRRRAGVRRRRRRDGVRLCLRGRGRDRRRARVVPPRRDRHRRNHAGRHHRHGCPARRRTLVAAVRDPLGHDVRRTALPQHSRARAGQRLGRPRGRGPAVRRQRRRNRWLPVLARRHRQHRDRGSRPPPRDQRLATGIDLDRLIDVARGGSRACSARLPGQVMRAGPRWAPSLQAESA